MADMIEKVAEAVMRKRVQYGWTFGKRAKVMAIDLEMARAALEALRTPTNEMIEAGVNRDRRDDLYTDTQHCFQVMVDKALGRVDLPVEE